MVNAVFPLKRRSSMFEFAPKGTPQMDKTYSYGSTWKTPQKWN